MGNPSIDAKNFPQDSIPTPCIHTICSSERGEENGIETVATSVTISGAHLIVNDLRRGPSLPLGKSGAAIPKTLFWRYPMHVPMPEGVQLSAELPEWVKLSIADA